MKRICVLTFSLMIGVGAWAQDVPKVEVPFGFSFVNVHPNLPPITSFNVFGGGGQIDVNFGRYFGIKGDFFGYNQSGLNGQLVSHGLKGTASGNVFTYMGGPQIKKHTGVFQPFAEAVFGGAHTNAYATIENAEGVTTSGSGNNNGFAMAAGGGIDLRLNRRFSLRPVEVDYLLTRFSANHIANYTANQNNFRYVAGGVLTFGGTPPPPVSAACAVTPTEIMAGDPVSATISTQNFDPKHTVSYQWSGTGVPVTGNGTGASVNTAGLVPASYTVSATATDAKEKKNNTASCTASFTVKRPPQPPVASCTMSPDTVKAGDSATLAVNASSPDGVPLSYSYKVTAGNVNGTGNSATVSSAGASPGNPITATAQVTDSRGLSTTCTAVVNVLAPPVVVQQVTEVGNCSFNDAKRPGRVDNECKAVLDDVALKVQREPNDTLVVVGYADDTETQVMTQRVGQRGVNVKEYFTGVEGGSKIDPSRIQVRAGTAKKKGVTIYEVPPGATLTEQTTAVDESQFTAQPRNAPATKKKR